MAVSVRDVAAAASVSVGTVSNVLNRPDKVSPETVARVLAAIDELGFVRNDAARQLRAGRSRSIGLVVLDVRNPFFTDVARGAEDRAAEDGMTILLGNSDENPDRERSYLDLFEEQRVHGVLISPMVDDLPRLARSARAACRWCWSTGSRRTTASRRSRSTTSWSGRKRCATSWSRGVGASRSSAGRRASARSPTASKVRERCSGDARRDPRGHRDRVDHGARGPGRGRADPRPRTRGSPRRRVRRERPARDGRAAGPRDAGPPRVPDEIALIGYDDIDFAQAAVVPLSSIRQPAWLIGYTAVDLLLREARHGADFVPDQVQFQPELVVRLDSSTLPLTRGRLGRDGSARPRPTEEDAPDDPEAAATQPRWWRRRCSGWSGHAEHLHGVLEHQRGVSREDPAPAAFATAVMKAGRSTG